MSGTVLIADNNLQVRRNVCELLQARGFTVRVSGDPTLSDVDPGWEPGVALVDMMWDRDDDADGLRVISLVAQRWPSARVIVFSERAKGDGRLHVIDALSRSCVFGGIDKESDATIVEAVTRVMCGERYYTASFRVSRADCEVDLVRQLTRDDERRAFWRAIRDGHYKLADIGEAVYYEDELPRKKRTENLIASLYEELHKAGLVGSPSDRLEAEASVGFRDGGKKANVARLSALIHWAGRNDHYLDGRTR